MASEGRERNFGCFGRAARTAPHDSEHFTMPRIALDLHSHGSVIVHQDGITLFPGSVWFKGVYACINYLPRTS